MLIIKYIITGMQKDTPIGICTNKLLSVTVVTSASICKQLFLISSMGLRQKVLKRHSARPAECLISQQYIKKITSAKYAVNK